MNFEMEADRMIDAIKMVFDKVAFVEVKDSKRETLFFGSGFVVNDGLILTCHHVIMGKQPTHVISVTLNNASYYGEIDDINERYDLATINIPKKGLVPVNFGKTSLVEPGQRVISIGFPNKLPKSATDGIISGIPDSLSEAGETIFLQNSTAISNGSSGGPLIDLNGKVLAINNYFYKTGFTFSIPCEYAIEFIRRAEEKKRHNIFSELCLFPRYLGICIIRVPLALIEEKRHRGKIPKLVQNVLEVSQVVVDSPGEKSGLSVGDLITKINNNIVNTVHDFIRFMTDDGDVIEVCRDNKLLSLILH